jgi:hypothetical protein
MKGGQNSVKPKIVLSDDGGNIYSLIGEVTTALEREGLATQSKEFVLRAIELSSYGEVMNLSHEYVQFPSGGSHEPATVRKTA